MPISDLLLAGAPARLEHSCEMDSRCEAEPDWVRSPLASVPSQRSPSGRSKRADPPKKATPQYIMQSFNSWGFKREQPADSHLMLQFVARAVRLGEPVPFVLYWGKGPRANLAAADLESLEFLNKLAERVATAHGRGAAITLILTDTHSRPNG